MKGSAVERCDLVFRECGEGVLLASMKGSAVERCDFPGHLHQLFAVFAASMKGSAVERCDPEAKIDADSSAAGLDEGQRC